MKPHAMQKLSPSQRRVGVKDRRKLEASGEFRGRGSGRGAAPAHSQGEGGFYADDFPATRITLKRNGGMAVAKITGPNVDSTLQGPTERVLKTLEQCWPDVRIEEAA